MFRKNVLELRNYGMFRKHLDFFEFLTMLVHFVLPIQFGRYSISCLVYVDPTNVAIKYYNPK